MRSRGRGGRYVRWRELASGFDEMLVFSEPGFGWSLVDFFNMLKLALRDLGMSEQCVRRNPSQDEKCKGPKHHATEQIRGPYLRQGKMMSLVQAVYA